MVQKETCHVDNTLIIENTIRAYCQLGMSREHGIQIVVDFEIHNREKRLVGILKDVVMIHTIPVLYLGGIVSGKDSVETHALIPVSRIKVISFETEHGFLDNLIPSE